MERVEVRWLKMVGPSHTPGTKTTVGLSIVKGEIEIVNDD